MVRINRYKSVFDKGCEQKYTTEILQIRNVRNTTPTPYQIKDINDEIIVGTFYDKELVRHNKKNDVHEVEKIFKRENIICNC